MPNALIDLVHPGGRRLTEQETQEMGPYFSRRRNLGDIRIHKLPPETRGYTTSPGSNQIYLANQYGGMDFGGTLAHELVHTTQSPFYHHLPQFPGPIPPSMQPSWWERVKAGTDARDYPLAYEMYPEMLQRAAKLGMSFFDFGPEQQAEIIRQYYDLKKAQNSLRQSLTGPEGFPSPNLYRIYGQRAMSMYDEDLAAYAPFVRQFEYGRRTPLDKVAPSGASASWPANSRGVSGSW